MFALIHRLLLGCAFAAVTATTSAASQPEWPTSPSRMELPTPYGKLHIQTSEYVYESQLRIDGADIDPPVKGMLNITYAYNLPEAQIALVSINTGDNGCPVAYRWVVLKKTGYTVTPEFGSCSDQIKVSAKGKRFTMLTPSSQNNDKIDMYVYDGKSVKRRAVPKPKK